MNMELLLKISEQTGILTGSLVWPAIGIFICFIFRKQLLKGVSCLTANMRSRHSNEPKEQSGCDHDPAQTQLESNEMDPELLHFSEIYSNLKIQNQVASIRTKDAIARDMADLVIRKKISRDFLAGAQDESIILALAATIRMRPEPKDADRLLSAANRVKEHHIKYRVALAFGMLLTRKLIIPSQVEEISKVMTTYEQDADAPLLHRLQHTQKMLSLYGQQPDA